MLFLKGFFEKEGLLSIREEILCTAGKHAILKEDTPVIDVAEDRLRVSLECRYQRKVDSIDSASLGVNS